MIRIGLVRHGRTAWNEAGKLQGRTDIPLSDQERDRLSSLMLPDGWRDADILSSPLSRARQTAEIIGKDVKTNDALIEMNLGSWEGRRGVDLLDDPDSGYCHVEGWGWDRRPPGGETPREIRARIEPVIANLERDTVIVSHINIMRVVLAIAHDWNFLGEMPFRIKRDRVHAVTRNRTEWHPHGDPVRLVSR